MRRGGEREESGFSQNGLQERILRIENDKIWLYTEGGSIIVVRTKTQGQETGGYEAENTVVFPICCVHVTSQCSKKSIV